MYGGFELEKVKKYETPYGARCEWGLLSKDAKLVVHLKDKKKIRHRKRWSQVQFWFAVKKLQLIHFTRFFFSMSLMYFI